VNCYMNWKAGGKRQRTADTPKAPLGILRHQALFGARWPSTALGEFPGQNRSPNGRNSEIRSPTRFIMITLMP